MKNCVAKGGPEAPPDELDDLTRIARDAASGTQTEKMGVKVALGPLVGAALLSNSVLAYSVDDSWASLAVIGDFLHVLVMVLVPWPRSSTGSKRTDRRRRRRSERQPMSRGSRAVGKAGRCPEDRGRSRSHRARTYVRPGARPLSAVTFRLIFSLRLHPHPHSASASLWLSSGFGAFFRPFDLLRRHLPVWPSTCSWIARYTPESDRSTI